MNTQEIFDRLKSKFGDAMIGVQLEAIDPWIEIAAGSLADVCRFLRDEPELRFDFLNCITAVDYLETDPKRIAKPTFEPHLEMVYHLSSVALMGSDKTASEKGTVPFCSEDSAKSGQSPTVLSEPLKHRLVLKASLPRWKDNRPGVLPEIASVANIWRTADWHEREVYDLSGVWFVGHPDLRRILCPEDWDGHPLRKDYEMPLEYHGIRGR